MIFSPTFLAEADLAEHKAALEDKVADFTEDLKKVKMLNIQFRLALWMHITAPKKASVQPQAMVVLEI